MRRIERLINLVAALLESTRPLTAEQIRSSIAGYQRESQDAFRRAFERDKKELRDMGIPIEVVQTDPFGVDPDGYTIPKARYYLPQIDLEPDELTALKIAADAVLGTGEEAESGFLKLSFDAQALPWSGPGLIAGADLAAEEPNLSAIYGAWSEHRVVGFDYETAAGDRSHRVVEPYGLIYRRGHWYLVGRDRDRDDVRSFKVTRMAGRVKSNGERFEPPEDFDARGHLSQEAWEIGDTQAVALVRFHPSMRWWADQNMANLQGRTVEDGSLEIELPVANLDALISWAIGFGPLVEIVEPQRARTRMLEHLHPYLEKPR
jgi:proteasome accessory factor B